MEKLYIISVEDQREVLDAILKDLAELKQWVRVEACESATEALELLEEIDREGDLPAVLISDHVMPEMTGVQFLSKVNKDSRFAATRKILLTGLATHEDTIEAINKAAINRYLEKPWKKEVLVQVIKSLTTEFILEKGLEKAPYSGLLDMRLVLEKSRYE